MKKSSYSFKWDEYSTCIATKGLNVREFCTSEKWPSRWPPYLLVSSLLGSFSKVSPSDSESISISCELFASPKSTATKMVSLREMLDILYQWQWLPLLVTLLVIYVTYYFVYVVKKPRVFCKDGHFRDFLFRTCPILTEFYWPTFWCFGAHAQTVIRALIRSKPQVPFRR